MPDVSGVIPIFVKFAERLMCCYLYLFSEVVSLFRERGTVDCADRPDAGSDNPPRICPAQIFQQDLIMSENRTFIPAGVVGVCHQQYGFFGNMDFPIDGIEAVNNGLELCGYAKIVHRGCKRDQIGRNNMFPDHFKIILKNARPIHAAGIAGNTRMNVT